MLRPSPRYAYLLCLRTQLSSDTKGMRIGERDVTFFANKITLRNEVPKIADRHVRFIELWGIRKSGQSASPFPRSESEQEDSFSSKNVQGQVIICKTILTQHRQHQINVPSWDASGRARLCTLETLHQLAEDRTRPRTVSSGQAKNMP